MGCDFIWLGNWRLIYIEVFLHFRLKRGSFASIHFPNVDGEARGMERGQYIWSRYGHGEERSTVLISCLFAHFSRHDDYTDGCFRLHGTNNMGAWAT
jgi:hypothetical protein